MDKPDPLRLGLDPTAIRSRTLHGFTATAVAQALKFVLQFGTQLIMARLLDPAAFGLVAMVMPVLGLVMSMNDFGLGQAVVQRSDISHKQVSSMFWISTLIGVGFTLASMAAAPLIAYMYGEPRTLWITVASASLILLTSLSVVPLGLLNRQMRFIPLAIIEVVAMAAGLASGIVSAHFGAGYWSLVIMQAVNALLSTGLSWATCGWRPDRPAVEPGVGALMRFGANIMGSTLATYLSMSADNVIVGIVNGKVALGLYDRSYNLVVKPLFQLMAPTGRVAIPLLSRLQESPERYGRAYLLMLQLGTLLCVPGLIATMIVAEPLISLLLGPKWVEMVPIFVWICFGGLFAALSSSTSWLFTTQNRTDEQMRYGTFAAVISIASFGLGSIWGVVGVAKCAALAFLFLQTPLLVWASTRKGPVTLAMVRRCLLPLAAAGIACALLTMGGLRLMNGSIPRSLMIVAEFVVSYAGFMLSLLAQPAGRRLVANARTMLAPRGAVA